MSSQDLLKAVVFDLDGTLLNCPYDFAAMRNAVMEVASAHGLSKETLSGMGILEAIDRGERLLSGAARRKFRREADAAVLRLERDGAQRSTPHDGAKDVLAWLGEKSIRVGIITRNSATIVRPLLRRAGFLFEALLAREDVSRVKPHPAHLLEMLAILKVEPDEALMVGDHIWDIACAKAAGLGNVGITSGASTKEALLQAGADAVLDQIGRLPAWLMENHRI